MFPLRRALALGVSLTLASCAGNDRSEPSPTPPAEGAVVIDRVLDYCPAPGQFTGLLPKWEAGDDAQAMNRKALEALRSGKQLVTLGGFGGYIVFGLSRTLRSVPGKREFRLLGNAYYASFNPNPNPPGPGGSSEPGVVSVAYDANKNGVPDPGEWYEIAGSEYHSPSTTRGYSITYYRPKAGSRAPVPGPEAYILDAQYIYWEDNQNQSGYIPRNSYHTSNSYYPEWIPGDKLLLSGTRLGNNAVWEVSSSKPDDSLWVLYAYPWGYADNHPNELSGATFDLDWCVDQSGQPVAIPGADFIRVHTGLRQLAGALGDSSTEVAGFVALP